ncbi:MAG TPA: DUF192 domain-containing protein [Ilumatobacter sp.]|nr:DUF192 domain-containing protein [Ilumatobacter sp.]
MGRWLVALAGIGLLAACAGSASPATTTGTPSTATSPQGFERVAARVTAADGEVCELCVWLADTPDLRSRGLMEVTSMGPAEAMAFVYPGPTTSSFWMKHTVLALSIAFFDADGVFLDSFDMEPCTTPTCPSYPTATGFTVAVEVPQSTLPDFLLVEGSTLHLLDLPCE